MAIIEDAHLSAALDQAEAVLHDAESQGCSSQAAAWWHCAKTLRRFLLTPPATLYPQHARRAN